MIKCKTYWASIYVGVKQGYSGPLAELSLVRRVVQSYVDEAKLCVTVTPTTFQYVSGHEPGCVIGLINYPRFPSTRKKIRCHALKLAGLLKEALEQYRVSIVFPDETIMLGER